MKNNLERNSVDQKMKKINKCIKYNYKVLFYGFFFAIFRKF